ncbi:MAG: cobyrinate a,c-diamide synthase [Sneathiella sp.]|nr:cobyrinate a,c-diamide synthase [Sneathiella sp.]
MSGFAVPSLLIAAPASGSGKTTITLALLRAFKRRQIKISSFKVGPDYIDPVFHGLASGRPCFNLDPWAMQPATLQRAASTAASGSDLLIGEGVMGLFDGAQNGQGSTADLAHQLNIPIILVVDAKGQAASVGALIHGFNNFRENTKIAGVIFNSVGSNNHKKMLGKAATALGIPVLAYIPRSESLILMHRHLGLVQARERQDIEAFLDGAADIIEANADLDKIQAIARPSRFNSETQKSTPLPGTHIAIARDDAFAFCYPHFIEDWKNSGAVISFFSPLKDEAPAEEADFIYLPGGYPELHAERLSAATNFKAKITLASKQGISIYGECGGFMTLGKSITDATGTSYPMLNLLPVATSFEKPKLHLGYRNVELMADSFLGPKGRTFKAHEFHYASLTSTENTHPLFSMKNALGEPLPAAGLVKSNVAGSFIHLIDRADNE